MWRISKRKPEIAREIIHVNWIGLVPLQLLWYLLVSLIVLWVLGMARLEAGLPPLFVVAYLLDALLFRNAPSYTYFQQASLNNIALCLLLTTLGLGVLSLAAILLTPMLRARNSVVHLEAFLINLQHGTSIHTEELENIACLLTTLPVDQRAKWHYNLGLAFYTQGSLELALDQLLSAVSLDSTISDAQYNIGRVFQRLGEHHKALKAFRQAERYGGDSGDIAYCMTMSLVRIGQFDDADVMAQKALWLLPSDSKWRPNLLQIIERMRKETITP